MCLATLTFFVLFTEITSLILKKDIVGQEQGAMAKIQLTHHFTKRCTCLECVGIGSEGMIQNYCQQQS
jgi:hypothetical protein